MVAEERRDDVFVLFGLARAGGDRRRGLPACTARGRSFQHRALPGREHAAGPPRSGATGSPGPGESCRAPSTGRRASTQVEHGAKGSGAVGVQPHDADRRRAAPRRVVHQQVDAARPDIARDDESVAAASRQPARWSCRLAPRRRPARARPGAASASSGDELRRLVLHDERPGVGQRRPERVAVDDDEAVRRERRRRRARRRGRQALRQFRLRSTSAVGSQRQRRRRVVEARPCFGVLEAAPRPAIAPPATRVRQGDGRGSRARRPRRAASGRGGSGQRGPAPSDAPQHGVDEPGCAALARLPHQVHRIVDDGRGGHAVEVEQLVGARAEGRRGPRGSRRAERRPPCAAMTRVERAAPPDRAGDDFGRERAIARSSARRSRLARARRAGRSARRRRPEARRRPPGARGARSCAAPNRRPARSRRRS